MVKFIETMGEHSRQIILDGKFIGHILWHQESPPRIVIHANILISINLFDMQKIVDELEKHYKQRLGILKLLIGFNNKGNINELGK